MTDETTQAKRNRFSMPGDSADTMSFEDKETRPTGLGFAVLTMGVLADKVISLGRKSVGRSQADTLLNEAEVRTIELNLSDEEKEVVAHYAKFGKSFQFYSEDTTTKFDMCALGEVVAFSLGDGEVMVGQFIDHESAKNSVWIRVSDDAEQESYTYVKATTPTSGVKATSLSSKQTLLNMLRRGIDYDMAVEILSDSASSFNADQCAKWHEAYLASLDEDGNEVADEEDDIDEDMDADLDEDSEEDED